MAKKPVPELAEYQARYLEGGRVYSQLREEALRVAEIAEGHGVDAAVALRIGLDCANGVAFRHRLTVQRVEETIARVFAGKLKKRFYHLSWNDLANMFIEWYEAD